MQHFHCFGGFFSPTKLSLVRSSHLYSGATGGLGIGPCLTADIAKKLLKLLTFPSCLSSACCSSWSLQLELLGLAQEGLGHLQQGSWVKHWVFNETKPIKGLTKASYSTSQREEDT